LSTIKRRVSIGTSKGATGWGKKRLCSALLIGTRCLLGALGADDAAGLVAVNRTGLPPEDVIKIRVGQQQLGRCEGTSARVQSRLLRLPSPYFLVALPGRMRSIVAHRMRLSRS